MVHDYGRKHVGEEEGREVVVEVEDAAHGPEGHIVEGPAGQQPQPRIQRAGAATE